MRSPSSTGSKVTSKSVWRLPRDVTMMRPLLSTDARVAIVRRLALCSLRVRPSTSNDVRAAVDELIDTVRPTRSIEIIAGDCNRTSSD